MDAASIFAFVLALVVAANVALAWIIYAHKQQTREEALLRSTTVRGLHELAVKHSKQLASLSEKLAAVEAQSPLELGVKVVELSEAVERLRKTHQKFAGRISQELGTDHRPDNAPPTIDRDELRRAHAKDIIPAGLKR